MLDSRINQNFNRPIVSPQFRATQNVTKPVEAEEKQGISTTAKWAIGLGLTALAVTGIYLVTKGRVKAPKPTPNPENPIQEIKEMAIDAFKKTGKFNQGKAILADGTKYTGNITSECKDGSKVVMEYIDGVLQKSTKIAKDGTKIFDKKYFYDETLGLKSIIKNNIQVFDKHLYKHDSNIIECFVSKNDKACSELNSYRVNKNNNKLVYKRTNYDVSQYLYDENNKLKYITESIHQGSTKKVTSFNQKGKKIFSLEKGKATFFEEGGESIYRFDDKYKSIKYPNGDRFDISLSEHRNIPGVDFVSFTEDFYAGKNKISKYRNMTDGKLTDSGVDIAIGNNRETRKLFATKDEQSYSILKGEWSNPEIANYDVIMGKLEIKDPKINSTEITEAIEEMNKTFKFYDKFHNDVKKYDDALTDAKKFFD